MPAFRFLATIAAAAIAVTLVACGGGSSGPSDADSTAAITAQVNNITYRWPVISGKACPPAFKAHVYDGVAQVKITPLGTKDSYGNNCYTYVWSSDTTITNDNDGTWITLGKYQIDKVGAPVATANATYAVPFNATFQWTPAGKSLYDKGIVVGSSPTFSAPQPTVSSTANLAKDANGNWKVQQ